METGEAPQSCGSGSRRRPRIQVFSALLEDKDLLEFGYAGVFGVVLLSSCNQNFLIFDSSVGGPREINPEGHLALTDPECSIPVDDVVHLVSWIIFGFCCSRIHCEGVLWDAHVDDMDRLIRRTFDCSSELHVSFAVYRDPVEAHLDVYFVDLKCGEEEAALIRVRGTVSASNSYLPDPEAKSFLFQKLGRERVRLKAGKSVPLTLSRKMIVVPHHSTLLVHVYLRVHMGHGNILTFDGTVNFNPSSDYAEEFIILPNHGKLLVKVTWAECEDRLEYPSCA